MTYDQAANEASINFARAQTAAVLQVSWVVVVSCEMSYDKPGNGNWFVVFGAVLCIWKSAEISRAEIRFYCSQCRARL